MFDQKNYPIKMITSFFRRFAASITYSCILDDRPAYVKNAQPYRALPPDGRQYISFRQPGSAEISVNTQQYILDHQGGTSRLLKKFTSVQDISPALPYVEPGLPKKDAEIVAQAAKDNFASLMRFSC